MMRIETKLRMNRGKDIDSLDPIPTSGMLLGYVSGLIKTSDADMLMKGIYRASRGKIVVQINSLGEEMMRGLYDEEDPESKQDLSVFLVIMALSSREGTLPKKIAAVVQNCKAKVLPLPISEKGFDSTIEDLERQVTDSVHLKDKGNESLAQLYEQLVEIDSEYGCSKIEKYRLILRKYKLIYSTLSMFIDTGSLLVGSFWTPKADREAVIEAVDKLKVTSGRNTQDRGSKLRLSQHLPDNP
jgi:vacuolar-type H+-ATPase subunit I/STV1